HRRSRSWYYFFFSSSRRHTRFSRDWSSDVCSSDLVQVIHHALQKSALPEEAVQLIEDTRRETAAQMFKLNSHLDVLIPRGGAKRSEERRVGKGGRVTWSPRSDREPGRRESTTG